MKKTTQHFSAAFTMLELIFVIVVMGILAKFGADIFRNVYDAYMLSSVQNRLQTETELALQQIGNRLQYRIKESVITRNPATANNFVALADHNGTAGYTVLEWVGYDTDGWLGDDNGTINVPSWSGIIDVDDFANAGVASLVSPFSDFRANGSADTIIKAVHANGSDTDIAHAAIIFTGKNSDPITQYGWWDPTVYDQSTSAMHRVGTAATIDRIIPLAGDDFTGVDVYEQYKLTWTAYALELVDDNKTDPSGNDTNTYDLFLRYDYQPWGTDAAKNNYSEGTQKLLLQDVSHATWSAEGDIIRIQICVANNKIVGDYSICKEKGYILKTAPKNRKGIALITAITFLLIVATLMAIMVSMTSLTTKRGADLYFQEQAHLLAKSATEFALLAISGHEINATAGCINQIDILYPDALNPIYDINTTIRYYGSNFPTGCNMMSNTMQTPESNGTVMIDVYVTASDETGTEPVRFHRRTMQKP